MRKNIFMQLKGDAGGMRAEVRSLPEQDLTPTQLMFRDVIRDLQQKPKAK